MLKTYSDLMSEAFIYFVEHLLPMTAGAKGWQEEMCSKPLSKMRITPSNKAFTLLCCENMWEKLNAEEETTSNHHDRGKYTINGTNWEYAGWLEQGLWHFNQLFREAVINQNKK